MGRLFSRLAAYLDRLRFLNIQIWEFSLRSLPREYGRLFFVRGVIFHPIRAVRGIRRYQRYVSGQSDRLAGPPHHLFIHEERVFSKRVARPPEKPLVGLGFCLKPFGIEKGESLCPSGRANHDCLYLEREVIRPVCAGCPIFKIAHRCLETGCRVYIMTSAKDIAVDFMFPQVERGAFPSAILLLCAFSVRAIVLPLLICGVDMFLLSYDRGDCRDYSEWLMADRGFKDEQTSLAAESLSRLLGQLDRLKAAGITEDVNPTYRRFRRKGNIFYPE